MSDHDSVVIIKHHWYLYFSFQMYCTLMSSPPLSYAVFFIFIEICWFVVSLTIVYLNN